MRLSKRDLEILAACTMALVGFDGRALSESSDVSHLTDAERDRAADLMENLSEDDLDAALSQAEWLYTSAERAS